MKKAKQGKRNCLYGILLAAVVCMTSGCAGKSKGDEDALHENNVEIESSTETGSITITDNSTETDQKKDTAEQYFSLIEGEWVVVEYAGEVRDSHCDEIMENWDAYAEEMKEWADELTEKYMGSEYRVETDNVVLDEVMEDNTDLFNTTRFIPGEFITITPPYVKLNVRLADKEEWYSFIIDANGVVLIELDYHFFRLERKTESKPDPIAIQGDYENIPQLLDCITDDMLLACEGYPSLESYWDDPLVLLNKVNENVRVYGLHANEQTAMLLYLEGERILVEYPFQTHYQSTPHLNICDIDDDGTDEIIITVFTIGGTGVRQYDLMVCDYEEKWNTYLYDDYIKEIEEIINYQYDEKTRTITFCDKEGNIMWEGELPEWAIDYPYKGVVNFKDDTGFSAENFQLDVVPHIELEHSLPHCPITIIFDISFADGEFKLGNYKVEEGSWSEW